MPDILLKGFTQDEANRLSAQAAMAGTDRAAWMKKLVIQATNTSLDEEKSGMRIILTPNEGLAAQIITHTETYEGIDQRTIDKLTAQAIQRDLGTYYMLLQYCLPKFEIGEAMIMADIMNGLMIEAHIPTGLYHNVDAAIKMAPHQYGEKWGADEDKLLRKLEFLEQNNPFALWAISVAIHLAWHSDTYQVDNMQEKVIAIGLAMRDETEDVE